MRCHAFALVGCLLVFPSMSSAQSCEPVLACHANWSLSNLNRQVYGELTQECGEYDPPFFFHDAPFGNWGVYSNFSWSSNGDQFMGWHEDGGQHHWNSCTDSNGSYAAPNSQYYNANNSTTQESSDAVVYGSYFNGGMEGTCSPGEGYHDFYIGGLFMEMDEKDWGCCDDYVGRLNYTPNIAVHSYCVDEYHCSGDSDVTGPSSGDTGLINADIVVHLETWADYIIPEECEP